MSLISCSRSLKLTEIPTDEVLQDWCSQIKGKIEKITSSSPRISVVFPAFNEEMYLPVMLNALSDIQTNQPIEFIGVNNKSTDRTAEILRESWVICIDEPRKGVSYARQTGLVEAKWDYIFTTDTDTIVPKKWIDANLQYFDNFPELVCFSGGVIPQWAHWSYYIARSTVQLVRKVLWEKGELLMSFAWANSVFKREVADAVGWYEPWSDLWEDNIIARKMNSHWKILHVRNDPSVQVITSARRVGTLLNVMNVAHSRLWQTWRNYEVPSGLKFSDVR